MADFGDALARWLASPGAGSDTPWVEPLFAALAHAQVAADADLPDTGVGTGLERLLSAGFIIGPDYGTRCTTVVLVEPGKHLGGMTAGGLSAVDIGDPRTVGSSSCFERVRFTPRVCAASCRPSDESIGSTSPAASVGR